MTGWQIACMACSTGWAVAAFAIWILVSASDVDDGDGNGGVTVPRWTLYVLFFCAMLGVSTCAAEDRVCEIAGLAADP